MKYINLSSLVRNANENSDIFSLAAKKAISLDFTINNTSGSINNFSTSEESSFKFTAATEITGFSGGTDGKILYLYNGNNSSQLTLKNNSSSSSSGNKILTNNGQDLIIQINGGAILQYDSDSLVWRTIGISNSHNDLILLQGGGSGNYYHSNQPINSTDNVSFNNLSVVSGVNVTGSVKLNNIIYPVSDGAANQVLKTDGIGNLSFGTITQDHSLLTNLQGGGGGNYYHSNQPINTDSNVAFNSINSSTLNVTGTSTLATTNMTTSNVSGELNVTGTSTQSTVNLTTGNVSGAFNVTGTSTLKNITASGSVVINGLTYPSTGGTTGQAITTDGSGNLSFSTISGGGGGSSISFTSSTDFPLGSPIYFSSSGTWQLAKADLDTTTVQYVVSVKTGSGTISYTALSSGELTLTTTQWDVITNASGGLTTSSSYFLSSSTAGKISTNVGLIYSPVLRAISSTKAFVSLSINSIESGMGDTFYRETTTTIATTSSITLTYPPAGKAYTWLSIDGVIQSGIDFSLAGNTLTLGGSVPTDTLIDVLYARAVLLADSNAINKMVAFSETVTGSAKTTFNLPSAPSGLSSCIVFIGGSIQDTSKFNISGNVLTMADSVPVGVQLIAYILNSSGTSSSIDSFVTRQTYSLPTSGTVNISTIFGSQVTASYRFFDITDPRISGTIFLKHNGVGVDPDVRVDSNSSAVSITQGTSGDLNIYISSFNLTFQNLTTNTLALRIYRET